MLISSYTSYRSSVSSYVSPDPFCFPCEYTSQNPTHSRPSMTGHDRIFLADLYEMDLLLFLNNGIALPLCSALFVPSTFQHFHLNLQI